MKLQIGRFGLELASGEVQSADSSGAKLSIEGRTAYANLEKSLALRQQLLGYVDNPDEDFVPVVWNEYPAFNGYYRVTGASVDGKQGLGPLGKLTFSADLERVQGFSTPLIEDTVQAIARPSTMTLDRMPVIAVPAAARAFVRIATYAPIMGSRAASSPEIVREGETGVMNVQRFTGLPFIAQFYLAPERYYDGAATISVGEPSRIVAGRQVANDPKHWTLSNGLLQVRGVDSDDFAVEYRMWDSTAGNWSPWVKWTFVAANGTDPRMPLPAPHTMTVLWNRPEMAGVRLTSQWDLNTAPVTVDLILRRGARYVSGELTGVFQLKYGMRPSGPITGPRVTSDGNGTSTSGVLGGGDYEIFAASPEPTVTTAQGPNTDWHPSYNLDATVDRFTFGFGMAFGSGDDDTARSAQEYFYSVWEKQSVVTQ